MANVNNPHGLRPLGISLSGGPQHIEKFSKLVGYGTAIFLWDAVNRVSGGALQASATPGTTTFTGVSLNYSAPSTAAEHLVITTPDAIFEAQGNGSGSLDAADEGLNANLVLTAGNAATRLSKHQIAESTKQTTATLDVHLLRLLALPDNEYGAYSRFEIVFNKHRMSPATAGV